MHQGAASGVRDAETVGVVIDVCRLRRLEQGIPECTFEVVEPPAHQLERRRASCPAHELAQVGADAVFRSEVSGQRVCGDQELGQWAELHDQVVGSVAGCGGPAVRLGSTAVGGDDDLCGMAWAFVGEPGESAVLSDLRLVEIGVAAADHDPTGDQWLIRVRGVPVEPAAEQVVAAATDAVQPRSFGGEAGVEADDTVRALVNPLPELIGGGDLSPIVEAAAEDGRGIPLRVVVQCGSRLLNLRPSDGRSYLPAGTESSGAIAG